MSETPTIVISRQLWEPHTKSAARQIQLLVTFFSEQSISKKIFETRNDFIKFNGV